MTKPLEELPGLLTDEEMRDVLGWTPLPKSELRMEYVNALLKAQRDKTNEWWIEWIEQTVNWRPDAPYKSTLDPEDFNALKDKLLSRKAM